MRADSIGMFWVDEDKIKPAAKEKIKVTPPERVWEHPGYLPFLKEALEFNYRPMGDTELMQAGMRYTYEYKRDPFVVDCEVYHNYFFCAFEHLPTNQYVYFEMWEGQQLSPAMLQKLQWMLETFLTIGFNTLDYDLTILALVLAGKNTRQLKEASDMLIQYNMRASDVRKKFKAKAIKVVDHIDLIEVAPLSASLKIYGGRLHTKRMQDLPFAHDTLLTWEQAAIIRWYCVNDLTNTKDLYGCLHEQIKLREVLGKEYGLELRSKSDAQIAEAVITREVEKACGYRIQKPEIRPGEIHKYTVPQFLVFNTPLMQRALQIVVDTKFVVGPSGRIASPESMKGLQVAIGNCVYTMGIGGLHSTEKSRAHFEDDKYIMVDVDVSSCYPEIIRKLGLYPAQMGQAFLPVYGGIVDKRLMAKAQKIKPIANSLKIVINGSFGKFGDPYSRLNSPRLLVQTTLTGQLSLLMLIERLELQGFSVISGNTDGIVILCERVRQKKMQEIIKGWERDTQFQTEETQYKMLLNRDVNNYIAVKHDMSGIKGKGIFANPWNDPKDMGAWLFKNPTNTICTEAIENYLCKNVPIEQTIFACKDIKKFVRIQWVKSGGVKITPGQSNEYLGKAVRWYFAKETQGAIVYSQTGNKVQRTDEGAKPCMLLPEEFPADINHDWYIRETRKMMLLIGLQVDGEANEITEEDYNG